MNISLPYVKSTSLRLGMNFKMFLGRLTDTYGLVSTCKHNKCKGKSCIFIDFDASKLKNDINDYDPIYDDTHYIKIFAELCKIIQNNVELVGNFYIFQSFIDDKPTLSYRAISPVMLDKDLVLEIVRCVKYIDLQFLSKFINYKCQTIRLGDKANNNTRYVGSVNNIDFKGTYSYAHMKILNQYLNVPILYPHDYHNSCNIIKANYETVSW